MCPLDLGGCEWAGGADSIFSAEVLGVDHYWRERLWARTCIFAFTWLPCCDGRAEEPGWLRLLSGNYRTSLKGKNSITNNPEEWQQSYYIFTYLHNIPKQMTKDPFFCKIQMLVAWLRLSLREGGTTNYVQPTTKAGLPIWGGLCDSAAIGRPMKASYHDVLSNIR